MAWPGCPEWRALGHPTLGLPSFLARAHPPQGLGELTSSCCGFGLMELSWLSRLLWGGVGGGGDRQLRVGSSSWCLHPAPECLRDLMTAWQGAGLCDWGLEPHSPCGDHSYHGGCRQQACLGTPALRPLCHHVPHWSAALGPGTASQ